MGKEAVRGKAAVRTAELDQPERELTAERGIDGGSEHAVAGGMERFLAVLDKLKGNARVRKRQVSDETGNGACLRAVALHELKPRGRVVKKVANDDAGALRTAGVLHGAGDSALQMKGRAALRAVYAGKNIEAGNGGNGGKRLAAEAQRPDGGQILCRAQLARGVTQEGGGQLRSFDAAAVVADAEVCHAAALQLDRYGGRTGVHGVFKQLLDDAGRALDDFAGGDQISDVRG